MKTVVTRPAPSKSLAAVMLFVSLLGVFRVASASELTIRFAWSMPPNTAISAQGQEIAQKIESLSHGSIKVNTYPSGSLLKETAINPGIANNTANMVLGGMRWWANQAPALEWGTIPFLVDDGTDMMKVLNGPAGQDIDALLQPFGVKVVGWALYGYIENYINTRHPIKVPADLKGLKVRSEGKLSAQFLESQGATPVAMDSSEVYTALERGSLDGAMSGVPTFISRKWIEPGKYVTAIRYVPQVYLVQVNRQWWNSLSDAQRQIIQKAVASTEGDAVQRIDKAFDADIAQAEKNGVKVYRLDSKDKREQWRKVVEPMAKKGYLKQAGQQGEKILRDVEKSAGNS